MIKKIEAIIRREKFDDVSKALSEIGIVGLNVSEVRGRGRQGGIRLASRSGSYKIDLVPKIQINIVLSDYNVEATVRVIREAARTGEMGDGMIFVYPVDNVYRISSNEEGHEAITYQGDIDTLEARPE
jgi:nitrogen regulatory protein P-II 1